MLLLSDSALPIGSFAYSSGLESFLMHEKQTRTRTASSSMISLFQDKFLPLSIHSFCHTTVPYVLSAFGDPRGLEDLDNDLDASTPCTVARRASISQGRALLAVWTKAFCSSARSDHDKAAAVALDRFAHALKLAAISSPSSSSSSSVLSAPSSASSSSSGVLPASSTAPPSAINGHLAPLWGCMCKALGLSAQETAYLFVFNHAKGVISAAVRASVMGPYMAQSMLASGHLEQSIRNTLERVWFVRPDDAGQVVPLMDLWLGRHEMLYSRIFNS
ncbi:hypothetical protein DV737_g2521, partial [Chaetothyriales sp. CBS 132003]